MTSRGRVTLNALGVVTLSLSPLPVGTTVVFAQSDGESRCGADGYVERYEVSSYTGQGRWRQTLMHCADNSSRDRSSSRSRNYGDDDNDGGPEDGESRCGADGYVERYEVSSYSGRGRWRQTLQHCR